MTIILQTFDKDKPTFHGFFVTNDNFCEDCKYAIATRRFGELNCKRLGHKVYSKNICLAFESHMPRDN